jgi:hypothetical protein
LAGLRAGFAGDCSFHSADSFLYRAPSTSSRRSVRRGGVGSPA